MRDALFLVIQFSRRVSLPSHECDVPGSSPGILEALPALARPNAIARLGPLTAPVTNETFYPRAQPFPGLPLDEVAADAVAMRSRSWVNSAATVSGASSGVRCIASGMTHSEAFGICRCIACAIATGVA